jgi:hypothetical protein
MQEQKNPVRRKSVLAFALLGAIGFGIGAVIGVVICWNSGKLALFPLMGAMGAASLGLALQGWRKAGVLALVGAISITVATLTGFVITVTIWGFEYSSYWGFVELFDGAIVGSIFGASLGLALRSWAKAGFLALAGAIGFGVGYQAGLVIARASGISEPIEYVILGVVGGALLGAALGYLEKKQAMRNTSS